MSDMGATSPGRWQAWQFLCRMGRTSLLNVTVVFGAAWAAIPIRLLIRQAARDTRSDFTRNYLQRQAYPRLPSNARVAANAFAGPAVKSKKSKLEAPPWL